MIQVKKDPNGSPEASSNTLVIDTALSDWVYHKNDIDQGLSLSEIIKDYKALASPALAIGISGAKVQRDGFIYDEKNGFVAAIIATETGEYKIIFRGTDVGPLV